MPPEFIFIMFLGVILILIIIIGHNRGPKIYNQKRQSLIDENQADCAISCKYLSGIDQMVEGKMCYIFASKEKLKIVTQETPVITINLELYKVKVFDIIKRDKTEPHMIGFAIVQQHTYDKFIIIRYLSDKDEIKEIYFSLINTVSQRLENDTFSEICNIFDYVNARIPKQETTIDL